MSRLLDEAGGVCVVASVLHVTFWSFQIQPSLHAAVILFLLGVVLQIARRAAIDIGMALGVMAFWLIGCGMMLYVRNEAWVDAYLAGDVSFLVEYPPTLCCYYEPRRSLDI